MNDYIINFQKSKHHYDFSIYQLGYEKCKSDHSFGPVVRDFYVLHFVVEGEGELFVDGKRYPINKGCAFLIPTTKIVRYKANPKNPYEYYWVGFNGTVAKDVLDKIGFLDDNYVMHYENISEPISIIKELLENKEMNELAVIGSFYKLLSNLIQDSDAFHKVEEDEELIEQLLKIIETDYMKDITVEGLAQRTHIHRTSVFRLFKKNFNVSPMEYLFDYRMDKALFLLKNTNFSAKAIALSVGFKSTSYFCKMFKKKYKKTTTETRSLR